MRGVDFYGSEGIAAAIKPAALNFRNHHGYWPGLRHPKTYSEKIFWQNYFGILPVPRAGNKLLTHEFIPSSLAGKVKTPDIYFRSRLATLPSNDEIAPGKYMLKANHGSGMNLQIKYPLTSRARIEAEAKSAEWLECDLWVQQGEWWYSTFEKEIFIERRLGNDEPPVDWRFSVFDGHFTFAIPTRVSNSVTYEIQYLDREFRPFIPLTMTPISTVEFQQPPRVVDASRFAEEIAKCFSLVRVDMYIEDDEIYLGEMTFSPANALTNYTRQADIEIGTRIKSIPNFSLDHCCHGAPKR